MDILYGYEGVDGFIFWVGRSTLIFFMGEWGWVELGGGIFWVVGVGVHFYG